MKTLKKIIALTLASLFVFGIFTACGKTDTGDDVEKHEQPVLLTASAAREAGMQAHIAKPVADSPQPRQTASALSCCRYYSYSSCFIS